MSIIVRATVSALKDDIVPFRRQVRSLVPDKIITNANSFIIEVKSLRRSFLMVADKAPGCPIYQNGNNINTYVYFVN